MSSGPSGGMYDFKKTLCDPHLNDKWKLIS